MSSSSLRQAEYQQSLECQKKLLAYELDFKEQQSNRNAEANLMREAAQLLSSVTRSRDQFEKQLKESNIRYTSQENEINRLTNLNSTLNKENNDLKQEIQ